MEGKHPCGLFVREEVVAVCLLRGVLRGDWFAEKRIIETQKFKLRRLFDCWEGRWRGTEGGERGLRKVGKGDD